MLVEDSGASAPPSAPPPQPTEPPSALPSSGIAEPPPATSKSVLGFLQRRAHAAAKAVTTVASRASSIASLSFHTSSTDIPSAQPRRAPAPPPLVASPTVVPATWSPVSEDDDHGKGSLMGSRTFSALSSTFSLFTGGGGGGSGTKVWVEETENVSTKDDDVVPELVEVRLVGRDEETKKVLTPDMVRQLQPFLPPLQRESPTWTLLYSMDQHGLSLSTLLRRVTVESDRPCMLCLRDEDGVTLGAFLSEPPARHAEGRFFGNGSCFLWTNAGGDSVYVYPATGENEFYMTMMVQPMAFAMGAGGEAGGFGLLVDDAFESCQSAPCATFGNPRLSARPRFMAVGVEVWGFEF
ncbi:oxidation resistance protein 1 [Phlyctochytrium bullatum]|nr:oxidation resistance protein 1 [Phlyctochytrium bullatum]